VDPTTALERFRQLPLKQRHMLLFSVALLFAAAVVYANVVAFHRGLTPDERSSMALKYRVAPISTVKLCLSDEEGRSLGAATGIQAIVVLGGGPADQATGLMPSWSLERCHRAAALHLCMQKNEFDLPVLCASGESAHAPHFRDSDGYTVYESSSMARCLLARGVAARNIFREWQSGDTVGNAVFVRSILTDPLAITRLLVVTSDFHAARSCAIFRWIYQLPSATRCMRAHHAQVACLAVPHSFPPEQADIAVARRDKEQAALERLHAVMPRIRDFEEVMVWLLREHGMYAVAVQPERLSGRLQAMYVTHLPQCLFVTSCACTWKCTPRWPISPHPCLPKTSFTRTFLCPTPALLPEPAASARAARRHVCPLQVESP
jgi:uncharacterized SAM-binding protein YcdF (DUF218 family)